MHVGLVLSRKKSEQIVIDGNIVVTVVGIHGDRVQIGVLAPPDVSIDRMEVHRRIEESE